MSGKSQPPGLDDLARDAIKQAAHLAIGLASLPLIGLTLLAAKSRPAPEAGAGSEVNLTAEDIPPAADSPPAQLGAGGEPQPPSKAGPAPPRADVEAALRTLSTATISKAPRPRRKSRIRLPPSPAP